MGVIFIGIGCVILFIVGLFQITCGLYAAFDIWTQFYWAKIREYKTGFTFKEELIDILTKPYYYIFEIFDYLNKTGRWIIAIVFTPFYPNFVLWFIVGCIILAPFYLFLYIFREKGDK